MENQGDTQQGETQPEKEVKPENQPEQVDPMLQMKTLTDEEKSLSSEKVNELLIGLYTNNLIAKSKDVGVCHVPTSLYPSPIPKSLFEKIFFYQIAFNKILNKLSNDQNYLETILSPLASMDNFIKKNLEISQKVFNYEKKQKIKLGVFRNDYLMDESQNFIFLTKYKTMCASLGTYTDRLKNFYNYYDKKYPEIFAKFKDDEKKKQKVKEIPMDKGDSVEKLTDAILQAIKIGFPKEYKERIIVFVVKKNDTKNFDINSLYDKLYEYKFDDDDKHHLKVVRLSLDEVTKKCVQDEEGNLAIDNKKVSLFYFCAGDKEEDYPDEESWKGRELIELSTAIKVPDINTFLTSCKVFQYLLSKPDIVMHYCYNELILNDILRFFGGVYYASDMDKDKQKELYAKIQSDPNKFIYRELMGKKGGCVTGENLKSMIPAGDDEPGEALKKGVIIEKLTPPLHETMILNNEKTVVEKVFSEYSVYGIILMDDKSLQINKSVSYLVRTKNSDKLNDFDSDVLDGSGNVAIDLPCLADTKVEPNLSHKIEVKAEDIQKYLDELKADEEAKKKAEEEAKKKAEEEEAKKKAEEEEAKKKAEGE